MIGENTPLVGSFLPLTYTPSYWRGSGGENAEAVVGSDAGAQRTREYYNSVFTCGGIDIGLRGAAVVQCTAFYRCFPTLCTARICCQDVSARFARAQVHLVTDVDGVAGTALLDAVAGRAPCTAGDIWINGTATIDQDRRLLIACMGTEMTLIAQLSVEDHLWCMVHLHKKERRSWKREMVLASANFTGIDTRRKICDLTEMERFRLQVAVELVLDPPALFFSYSFDSMNPAQQEEGALLLHRLTQELGKTVVLSTRTLPTRLFSIAESLLLLGAGGLVLYSGKCKDAIPYFNRLCIPSNIPAPVWKAVLTPTSEASAGENGAGTSCLVTPRPAPLSSSSSSAQGGRARSEARLFAAMCVSPRLSSRLTSAHFHDDFAQLLTTREPSASPERMAVVEVATSGDLVDVMAEWAESTTQTMHYAAKYYDSPVHAALLAALEGDTAHISPVSREVTFAPPRTSPNSMWKFCVLLTYSLRQIAADAELVAGVLFLSVGLTLVAVLAHSQPEGQGGMYNIRGLIFMAFTIVLFTNLVTMDHACDQLRVAVLHCKRQLYGVASFVACLGLRIMLIHTVYLALFFPFVVLVLRSSYALALLVWCVGCTHAAFHYTAAAVLPSRWWTVRVWYIVFGFNIIFSGFLLNLQTIPALLSDLSFIRWGYGAVLYTWLHGNKFECDGANHTSYCYTGDQYLKAQGMEGDSVTTASLVLLSFSVGLLAFLWCILHVKVF